MNPLFHTEFSISDSLKNVRKSVLIYETIIDRLEVNQWEILLFGENREWADDDKYYVDEIGKWV